MIANGLSCLKSNQETYGHVTFYGNMRVRYSRGWMSVHASAFLLSGIVHTRGGGMLYYTHALVAQLDRAAPS